MNDYESIFDEKVQDLKSAALYRSMELPRGLEFQHNDYLGLSTHPEILEAMADAIAVTGAGSRGSRLLGGHNRFFEETEEAICRFFGAPAAVFFSSGFMANLAAMQVLSECVDHVFSDEYNHASLIDGIRLGKAQKTVVPHQRWNEISPTPGKKLFVAEALYSMEGDLLGAPAFKAAVLKSDAFAHVDEAHSAGVFLESGRGLEIGKSLGWSRYSQTVTFGKAFGLSGAAILCSKSLKELLINRARTFIYTTAPSPIVLIGIQKALEIVDREAWRREELWSRAERVREILGGRAALTTDIWQRRAPIISVEISGEERALSLARNMREFGFDLRAIRFPTVAKGRERIRVTLSLQVSRENTEMMARLLLQTLEKM